MNERIRQLAEQAGLYRDQQGLYWDSADPEDGVDLEKFAKLVIEECMVQVSYDEHSPSYEGVARIAKHFGVE